MRKHCHALALELRQQLIELTGNPALTPSSEDWFVQMFAVQVPTLEPNALQKRLYDDHHIEGVAYIWNQLPLLRVSIAAYNDENDCESLLRALKAILPSNT